MMIGIPLESDRRSANLTRPLLSCGEEIAVPGRRNRGCQETLKERSADAKPECDLLVLLGTPPRAVHHPQEVRLDPTHPREAEVAPEVSVRGCVTADRRVVRLVNDHALVVELGQDVPPGFRPDL